MRMSGYPCLTRRQFRRDALTLSSPTKASLFWTILWRCCGAAERGIARFQLHLIESGASICNRNRIMTGVRSLFRVTLPPHDLAAEVWHLKEPQKLTPVLSPDEVKRVLTMATSLKARAMLTLAYGCGLRAARWCGCERATSTASRRSSASCSRRDR